MVSVSTLIRIRIHSKLVLDGFDGSKKSNGFFYAVLKKNHYVIIIRSEASEYTIIVIKWKFTMFFF